MQLEPDAERVGRALARVIVGRRADAAEAEDDIFRGECAPQSGGDQIGNIAEVLAPGELHSSGSEYLDQSGKVLVGTLADDDLVADDDRSDSHIRLAVPSIGSPRKSPRRART